MFRETGRKTPNQLPNFRLISTKFRLIFCLIADKLPNSQSRFFRLGDAPRDRPATPEMGTYVPNGRRHGGAAAICKKSKSD